VEAGTRLFLAREVQGCEADRRIPKSPATLDAKEMSFLMHVLAGRNSLLIPNTAVRDRMGRFQWFSTTSWLCVPLVASNQVSGFFRSATRMPRRLPRNICALQITRDSCRGCNSECRLYETSGNLSSELEQRLADLEQAQKELREVQQGRELL